MNDRYVMNTNKGRKEEYHSLFSCYKSDPKCGLDYA
jgi:hypothetical protein